MESTPGRMRDIWNRVSGAAGSERAFVLPTDNPQTTHLPALQQTIFVVEAVSQDDDLLSESDHHVLLGVKTVHSAAEKEEPGFLQWIHLSHEGIEFEVFLRKAADAAKLGKEAGAAVVSACLNRILPSNERSSFQGKRFLPCWTSIPLQLPGDAEETKISFVALSYFWLGKGLKTPGVHHSKFHWVRPLVQSAYHLHSSTSRENQQAIRRIHSHIPEFLHVPQLWILTIGEKFVATCSPTAIFNDKRSSIVTRALGRDPFPPIIRVTMSPSFVFCLKRDDCRTWFEFFYRVYDTVKRCLDIHIDPKRYVFKCQKDSSIIDGRFWPSLIHSFREPLYVLMSPQEPQASESLPLTLPLEGRYGGDTSQQDATEHIRASTAILSDKTLDAYRLPYYWDSPRRATSRDLIIAQRLTELDQMIIFDHTRRLRAMHEDFSSSVGGNLEIENPSYTPPRFVLEAATSQVETKVISLESQSERDLHRPTEGGTQRTSTVGSGKKRSPPFKWSIKNKAQDTDLLAYDAEPHAEKAKTQNLNQQEAPVENETTATQRMRSLLAHMHYDILFNSEFSAAKKYNELPLKTLSGVMEEIKSLQISHPHHGHMLSLASLFVRQLSRILESFIGPDYDCIVVGKIWAAAHCLILTFRHPLSHMFFRFHCDVLSIPLRRIRVKIQKLRDGQSGVANPHIPHSLPKAFRQIVILLVDVSCEASRLMQEIGSDKQREHVIGDDDKSRFCGRIKEESTAQPGLKQSQVEPRAFDRLGKAPSSPSIDNDQVHRKHSRSEASDDKSVISSIFRRHSQRNTDSSESTTRSKSPATAFFGDVCCRMDEIVEYLEDAQDECCAMFRSEGTVDHSAYNGVDCATIVALVMESVLGGHSTCESLPILNVEEIYETYTNHLQLKARTTPSKSLLVDMSLLREELDIMSENITGQLDILNELCQYAAGGRAGGRGTIFDVAFSGVSSIRTPIRRSNEKVLREIQHDLKERLSIFEELTKRVGRLETQICQRVEISEENHGKAILVFTIVSTIFLPLSFVSSYLGMNTSDIRNMELNQALFWEVAVPSTVVIVSVVLAVAYNLNAILTWIPRARTLPYP
ncbi:hypothetical protein BDV28DRAFT_145460 [Aspergillus coremiiformis]|uniref:Cora-like Mg2+ transporter protein-domain-containing protein n=1 Tax=Aspergillus coremiiformis TaxID=138285 RepID=A0A5N6ZF60_9EURO|nr:hypothetical protein BDV28DRAFT_145460 [Aspergillus coremiiformis]